MATIQTIAKDLNLSAATVSRALRGTRGVNEATRSKVQSAAERLGYTKLQRPEAPKNIALIVPSKSHADMFELARRFVLVISEEFARRGWRLFPVFVPAGDESGMKALASIDARNGKAGAHNVDAPIDGCLVIGRLQGDLPARFHKSLAEQFNGNIVMLSRHDVLNGLSGVASMNYAGGVEAIRILLDAGHRKIGWIGSLGSRDSAEERLGGVLTQIHSVGASLACELWLDDTQMLTGATVSQKLEDVLPADCQDWPTAWVCSTDWLAAKLIVWGKGRGIDVPAQMSVAAFDNTQVASELAEMTIASVVFPYEQIASKAVELLETLLNAPAADAIVWSLPPRVRRGETVAQISKPKSSGSPSGVSTVSKSKKRHPHAKGMEDVMVNVSE